MARTRLTIHDLPLFASAEEIGEAVLGFERRKEFRGMAEVYMRHGMPQFDLFWGGWYVPAVKAFFDSEYGIGGPRPMKPGGVKGEWQSGRRKPGPEAPSKGKA